MAAVPGGSSAAEIMEVPVVQQQQQQEEEAPFLLPGFGFYPTEEVLVGFYLTRMVQGLNFNVIPIVDPYNTEPWDLQAMAPPQADHGHSYFFVRRDRRAMPIRKTQSGFWKPSGYDKPIHDSNGRVIGLKKTLVFYAIPRPGTKTGWVMLEYRLAGHPDQPAVAPQDDYVLCKLYQKKETERAPAAMEAHAAGRRSHDGSVVVAPSSWTSPVAPAPSGHGHGAPAPSREATDASTSSLLQ